MPIPFDPTRLYHRVFPGIETGEEDHVTWETLKAYQDAVGRDAAWVYFSHEWSNGEWFPVDTVRWIHSCGRIPFVRLMMRHDTEQASGSRPDPDPSYSLASINSGAHDEKLYAWGRAAANDFGAPWRSSTGRRSTASGSAGTGCTTGRPPVRTTSSAPTGASSASSATTPAHAT